MAVNDIKIILSAVDKASEVFNRVWGNLKNFSKRHEENFTRMRNFWTVAFGAISASIYKGNQDLKEFEGVTNRLSHLLKTATGATEENVQSLIKQAEALEKSGIASKDNIINAQAQLATFDLQHDTINRLIPSITDYVMAERGATATSEDFKSMTNWLAQALQGNFASLTRSGFVLDDHTKSLITNGTEMERAVALASILDWTYKGFNASLMDTAEGIAILRDRELGWLNESVASVFTPAIKIANEKIIEIAQSISWWIQKNPELTKIIIILTTALVGLVAVLGIIGLAIPAIVIGIWSLLSPIGLIIWAVIALGVAWSTNLLWIRDLTFEIFGVIKEFWAEWGEIISQGFVNLWETIVLYTEIVFETLRIIFESGLKILSWVFNVFSGLFTGNWSLMWEWVKTILSSAWEAIRNIIQTIALAINEWIKSVFGVDILAIIWWIFASVYDSVKWTMDSMFTYISDKFDAIVNKIKSAQRAISEFNPLWNSSRAAGAGIYDFIHWTRATGGYTSQNTPYLVGERWPELFIPTGSGRVMTNSQTMNWGQSVNISFGNVTISNGMELEDLTNKIKSVIYNEHKYARLWY